MMSTCRVLPVDEERILSKLAELDRYLHELEGISPKSYKAYETSIEKKGL